MGVRRFENFGVSPRRRAGGSPRPNRPPAPVRRGLGSVLWAAVLGLCVVQAAPARPARLPPVPAVVEFTDHAGARSLPITGTAVRRRLLVDVYAIAHYMDPPPSGELPAVLRAVLEDRFVKQVTMTFLRDIGAERIQRSLVEAIQRNSTEAQYQEILPLVGSFAKAIAQDVERGDQFVIRRLPGGTVVSLFEGREISRITSRTFARVMWSIWFGERSVVDRTELLRFLTDNTHETGS